MSDQVYLVIYDKRTSAYGFGEPLRVLYQTTSDIARAVCSDPRTAGRSWFIGWTYIRGQRVRWVRDDGRFAEVWRDLGLEVAQDGERRVLRRAGGGHLMPSGRTHTHMTTAVAVALAVTGHPVEALGAAAGWLWHAAVGLAIADTVHAVADIVVTAWRRLR